VVLIEYMCCIRAAVGGSGKTLGGSSSQWTGGHDTGSPQPAAARATAVKTAAAAPAGRRRRCGGLDFG
jgi:hypothetical protein